MIRVKSAPANIAEMVNRKKIISEKKTEKSKVIILFLPKKETIVSLKNKINIERIFNNIILDSINNKELLSCNDEQALFISILYFYVCEKIFTKNNLREFMLFITQMFIRYFVLHNVNQLFIMNKGFIESNIKLLEHLI